MKKILVLLLSAIMLLNVNVINVSAGVAPVAKIGDTDYQTLQEAITNAQDNTETTITMIDDVSYDTFTVQDSISAAVVIPSTKKIILDLNGKTISGTSEAHAAAYLIHNKGYLTIIDSSENGKITYKSNEPDGTYGYGTSPILNRGVLTIKSGTVENTTSGGASYAVDNQTLWYDDIIPVVFNLEGGNVVCTTGDAAIRQGAGCGEKYTKGGEIVKNYVNIKGGTVTGDIWIQNLPDGGNKGSYTELKITDGIINGKIYDTATSDYSNQLISIEGGYIDNSYSRNNGYSKFITGGYFKNNVSNWVKDDHVCINTPETDPNHENYPYMIGKLEIAKIGDTTYSSLKEAIKAVPENIETTIKMIDDVSYNSFNEEGGITAAVVIPSKKKIVLDLNGKTITGLSSANDSAYLFHNKGYLTIVDTQGNGKMKYHSDGPDNSYGYGTSTILNRGVLTINSGTIINTTVGGASYAVDNQTLWYDDIIPIMFDLNGGNINCTTGDAAIRQSGGLGIQYTKGGEIVKNYVNINGGTVTGDIWVQNSNNSYTDLKIVDGVITGRVYDNAGTTINNLSYSISGGKIDSVMSGGGKTGFITNGYFKEKSVTKNSTTYNLDSYVVLGYKVVDVLSSEPEYSEGYRYKIGTVTKDEANIVITNNNDVPNYYKNANDLQEVINNVIEANQEKFEKNKNEEVTVSTITVNNSEGINAQIDDKVKIIANEGSNNVTADPGYKMNTPVTEGGKTTYTATALDIGKYVTNTGTIEDAPIETRGTKASEKKNTIVQETSQDVTEEVQAIVGNVNDTDANIQLGTIVSNNLNTILTNRGINQGTAAKALNNSGIVVVTNDESTGTIKASNISVFVRTYYETEVLDDKTQQANKSFALEITPMYQAYASTATTIGGMVTDGTGTNSVKIGESVPVNCAGKTITLRIDLPEGFINETNKNSNVYVIHTLANGTKTYVTRPMPDTTPNKYYIVFDNPDGFSKFEFTLDNPNKPQTDRYVAPKTGIR